MSESQKLRVFLCHASQDKPVVRELYQRLLAEGWIDPWLDEEKLLPGQDWDLEIEKAVESADAVIVCLSNNLANKEGYIQKELRKIIDRAQEKSEGAIFIIPIRLEDSYIPSALRKYQYQDYYPAKNKSVAYRRLLGSLRNRTEKLNITIFGNARPSIKPMRKIASSVFVIAVIILTISLSYKPIIKLLRPNADNFIEVKEEKIQFDQYILNSGALEYGETRLFQSGAYGVKKLTIQHVVSNGIEISQEAINTEIIPPIPEIILVGKGNSGSFFGRLAYIAYDNAWIMDGSTNQSKPVTFTGDLDGRIFVISPDGNWLMFTRKSTKPLGEEINTLWVVGLQEKDQQAIDLHVSNIVHFASFVPGRLGTISYSTVKPRVAAPGWQANNDLYLLEFDPSGFVKEPQQVIENNPGGVYGWWGTNYSWSFDGFSLAYSQPDSVGLVDLTGKSLRKLLDIVPYNTHSDWAFVPLIAWSKDGRTLLAVTHSASPSFVNEEDSPFFSLTSISLISGDPVEIVSQTGMFAHPTVSPPIIQDEKPTYLLTYLQAIDPERSETSRYKLLVMDSDGSNRRDVFPMMGLPGVKPQMPVWEPSQLSLGQGIRLALIYEGNVWFINIVTGEITKVTDVGSVSRIDWK